LARAPTMPAMPTIGRTRQKVEKVVVQPEQVAQLIVAAQNDERGVYYAFPFLASTRPSEQLALHWKDLDFERNPIRIHRM